MKRALVIVGVFTAGLAFAADAKDDATKKDEQMFNGSWKAVSAEYDGKEVPKGAVDKMTLTVKGDEFTLHRGDDVVKGTNKIDASKTPKTIDSVRSEGQGKGDTSLGIYELTDDTYKVCFGPPGGERPTEFVSKPGSKVRLIVMKREKP
jgi:uncharacterized protein (TIGR03067 family)